MKRSKITNQKVLNITDDILESLSHLNPYLFHVSRSSVYIKFEDERLRSLRISDHKGKRKYPYKWNIILGSRTYETSESKRFFFNEGSIRKFIKCINAYWKGL